MPDSSRKDMKVAEASNGLKALRVWSAYPSRTPQDITYRWIHKLIQSMLQIRAKPDHTLQRTHPNAFILLQRPQTRHHLPDLLPSLRTPSPRSNLCQTTKHLARGRGHGWILRLRISRESREAVLLDLSPFCVVVVDESWVKDVELTGGSTTVVKEIVGRGSSKLTLLQTTACSTSYGVLYGQSFGRMAYRSGSTACPISNVKYCGSDLGPSDEVFPFCLAE